MPPSPTVICKRCKRLTNNPNRYCDNCQEHYLSPQQAHDKRRGSPSKRGYDSTWVKCRNSYLSQHPLCEGCEKEGYTTMATEVHHIIPIMEGGSRLDFNNLKALCKSCHSKITAAWRGR